MIDVLLINQKELTRLLTSQSSYICSLHLAAFSDVQKNTKQFIWAFIFLVYTMKKIDPITEGC